jgi:phosphohistidine phosphatase
MKTLLLMRHAKSSWKDKKIPDIERPIKKRGHKDAQRIGKLLCEKELVPQKILRSTAVRARQTVDEVVDKCKYKGEVEYIDGLYMAEPAIIIEILRKLPDDLERVMVVSHNPGLEGFTQMMSGEVESMSTGALAHIVLPIEKWEDLNGEVKGDLVDLFRPRDIK